MKTVLEIEESEKCVHGLGGKVDEGSSMVNAIALLYVIPIVSLSFKMFLRVSSFHSLSFALCFPCFLKCFSWFSCFSYMFFFSEIVFVLLGIGLVLS